MFQKVTILILIDGFLQFQIKERKEYEHNVTILILIDGFLQLIDSWYKSNKDFKSQSLF